MPNGRHRRHWESGNPSNFLPREESYHVQNEIDPNYEGYLLLLQERNKIVKKLQVKDPKQIELERKEQGFSLYLNGANYKDKKTSNKQSQKHRNRRNKTSAGNRGEVLTQKELDELIRKEIESKLRAKTAPERSRRKNWNAGSVDIQTARGEKVKIRAPVILTGEYEDDFEADVSYESSEGSQSESEEYSDSYDSDSMTSYQQEDSDCEVEEMGEQISLTVRDVKKLRESLQMNASICESIAQCGRISESDSDCESPIHEEEEFEVSSKGRKALEDQKYKLQSPSNNTAKVHTKSPGITALKADDVIVLEFAPNFQRKNCSNELVATRRKDSESLGILQESHGSRTPRSDRLHRQNSDNEDKRIELSREVNLKLASPRKKSCRPPSAVHNKGSPTDQSEVWAVIEAIKAENKAMEKQHDENKRAADPKHQNGKSPQARFENSDRHSSASLSWKNKLKSTSTTEENNGNCDSWAVPSKSSPSKTGASPGQNIDDIVQKVLQLDQKGQRRLLKALHKIEKAEDSESSPNSTLDSNPGLKLLSQMKNHKKASCIEISIHLLSNWGHPELIGLTEVEFFDLSQNKIQVKDDDLKVTGSQAARGQITAICNGKCKTVKDRNMWCCKKPDKHHPLCIKFTLQPDNPSIKHFAVSRLRIWNYNKSLNDLSIGVCNFQIEMNGKIIYEGELDKGCGNQVFNYAKEINLETCQDISTERNPKNSIKLSKEEKSNIPKSLSTPTMDRVSLFSNTDSDQPYCSDTRLMNHEEKTELSESSPESRDKSSDSKNGISPLDKPRQSSGEPRSRRRKVRDRERKSKMAARLDGSHSSVDTSFASAGASVDRTSINLSQHGISHSTDMKKSRDINKSQRLEQNNTNPTNINLRKDEKKNKPPINVLNEKPPSAIPDYLYAPNQGKNSSVQKPGSPYFSDEDSGSMLDQLRKYTKDKKPAGIKSDLPPWLNDKTVGATPKQKDDSLLDNWPIAGLPDLPTILDDDLCPSPMSGRRSRARTPIGLAAPELNEDSGRSTPMQEIEQKRNEWRKKQQFKLEESWTSLNLFDRSQKGRISLDLQKDVLDEYLSPEKMKPSEPTIIEEEPMPPSGIGGIGAEEGDSFTIPELPMGRDMVINILTTWGDHHYVGLNGIEIFTSTGDPANVIKMTADPEDINVLPDYNKDPRVVANLIDGVNRTRDDTHMWLAPYTKGAKHLVNLTFYKPIQIAMMRIWNYNKSRIHSYRGAKDIEITLDGQLIFRGEITRACGGIIGTSESFGETILFTMEDDILELVSQHDQAFEMDLIADNESEEEEERPPTADSANSSQRPFTSAAHGRQLVPKFIEPLAPPENDNDVLVLKGQYLKLNFLSTWGDPYYLGLTGLEVVGKDGESLPLSMSMIDADPRDLHVMPGYESDDRTLDKLIDGTNITTSDEHMWLIPFTDGEDHVLSINMGRPTELIGLRFWNYNKSPEDTYRGAKTVHVMLDGRQVSPSEAFLIRKGPGNCYFDFAQEVSFIEPQTPRTVPKKSKPMKASDSIILEEPSQEYEVVQMPCGFIYQFQLLSTWGDPYYVGLNGLEFYDCQGNLIQLEENNISAYPDSCNVLDGIENDTRTPDKLIDGENDTSDGRHMWLSPVLPNILNRVYVIFDTPMEISMIKLWNYNKSPKRGVKDFALLVDDLLVYNGLLEMAAPDGRGILPTCDGPQKHHTILFSDDKQIRQEKLNVKNRKQIGEQDVQLLNDRKFVSTYSDPQRNKSKPVDQSKRPTTSVPGRGRKL